MRTSILLEITVRLAPSLLARITDLVSSDRVFVCVCVCVCVRACPANENYTVSLVILSLLILAASPIVGPIALFATVGAFFFGWSAGFPVALLSNQVGSHLTFLLGRSCCQPRVWPALCCAFVVFIVLMAVLWSMRRVATCALVCFTCPGSKISHGHGPRRCVV